MNRRPIPANESDEERFGRIIADGIDLLVWLDTPAGRLVPLLYPEADLGRPTLPRGRWQGWTDDDIRIGINMLRRHIPPHNIAATLYLLSGHPDPRVRQKAMVWFGEVAQMDGRDRSAIAARLEVK